MRPLAGDSSRFGPRRLRVLAKGRNPHLASRRRRSSGGGPGGGRISGGAVGWYKATVVGAHGTCNGGGPRDGRVTGGTGAAGKEEAGAPMPRGSVAASSGSGSATRDNSGNASSNGTTKATATASLVSKERKNG